MQTVKAYIDHHASTQGERTFLVDPESGRALSYRDLQAETRKVAAALDAAGVESGAKVAFLLNNGYWTTIVFLGVMAAGRVVVPLNAVSGATQLRYVLDHSDAATVVVSGEYRIMLDEMLAGIERDITVIDLDEQTGPGWPITETSSAAQPRPGDVALLLYTSGSTGKPKGALLNHLAVTTGGRNVVVGHGLTREDRALCVLPVYHINGAMVTVMAPLVSGGSVVMPARFSVQSFWKLIHDHGCTWTSVVPTIIKYLLDRAGGEPWNFDPGGDMDRFRFARSASAPLPAVVLAEWEQVFHVPMIETLGLTETAGTVATNPMPPARRKPGSVGRPCGNEMRVIDDRGEPRETGQAGELVVRGENVLEGYYKNPEATGSAFIDGWFRTGDLGFIDEDGYIHITGRLKELIIRGGENIAPREIDDVLYRHEAVLEAAAVGIDDEQYGQEVVACVALRDGFKCSEEELIESCRLAIGPYKAPKRIYFLDELPKGPSGKIQRLKLPDLIGAGELR